MNQSLRLCHILCDMEKTRSLSWELEQPPWTFNRNQLEIASWEFLCPACCGMLGKLFPGIIWMKNCQEPEPPSYIPWCPIVFFADGVSSQNCFRAQAHGHPSRKSINLQQMPCKPLVWSKHLRLMPHCFDSWKPGSSRSTKFDIVRLCSTCIFCMIALTLWIQTHRIQCIP